VGVAAFVAYFFVLYPRIPQEFGGVRPDCALLDLNKEAASASLLRTVGASTRDDTAATVLTSEELKVLFVGGDFVVVRPPNDASSVLHIKKDSIESMQRIEPDNC
jgi:hypothetical protein